MMQNSGASALCGGLEDGSNGLHGISAAHFAEILRGADFGFWCIDLSTDTTLWFSDWCEAHDIDPCAGVGELRRWDTQIHTEDRAVISDYEQAVAGGSDAYEIEYRVRTRAGDWRWVHTRARVLARSGNARALRIGGVTIDIHARKTMELALRSSEARLEAAVWGTGIGVWENVVEGRFQWLNDWCASLDIDPCDRENGSDEWRSRIHPDDLGPFVRQTQACRDGWADHYVVEYRLRTIGGRWRWLHERGKVVERNPVGPRFRFVGVCFDIDARKQMEAALQAAELRYEVSIHAAQLPVWEYDVRADQVRGNIHWHRVTDPKITEDQARARSETWLNHVHPDDAPILPRALTGCSRGAKSAFEFEFRICTPADQYRWMLGRGRVTEWDADGKPLKLIGISLDIDARKRMELALRTQALILETMHEGVALLGKDGRIEFTNPAFKRLFGRPSVDPVGADLAGTPAIDLLNARWRAKASRYSIDRLIQRFGARIAGRQVELRRGDGTPFGAEILTAAIDMHGEKKTLCVVQDVSERKRLERQVTDAAYQERRRLGSDLHDGLGQELTGIALLLRSLAQSPDTAAGAARSRLEEIIVLVNHAIDGARTMAAGLSPVRLAHGGLVSALRSLSEWSGAIYGIRVTLQLIQRCDFQLDEASATHLYLIAQEAIVNAAKHGRSRQVIVKLRVNRELISLSAVDDGIGLGAGPERSNGAGLGLKIMEYRAGAVGGSLQVKRLRRGGTQVRCVCPHAPR